MDGGIAEYKKAYEVATTRFPKMIPQLQLSLGIAYLHRAEMQNDLYGEPGERCVFPILPRYAFKNTLDSEEAIKYFRQYLDQNPNEWDAKWLLNMAYMMMGKYPADVPPQHLLAPSLFESKEDVGRFVDVAPQAGLNLMEMAGGVIADEFENNGLFDVVISGFDMCAPIHFFHNNGDGTFADKTVEAGLSDQLQGANMTQTDYNNDGCIDIFIMRGGWEFPQRQSLLRNNCNGTFTDVTEEAGLAKVTTATGSAVWADINNDGLLDLFVSNELGSKHLYLNKGNGTFEDITHSAGLDKVAFTKGIAAADYDGDGYVDFFVSNLGTNSLYHNNHDNTFTDVAEQAGVATSEGSFSTWFFDYDNDGLPDLFVACNSTSLDETVRTYVGAPHQGATLRLFKNLGNGTFKDVTVETNLDKVFMPMGSNFGDVDNDGYLDIYLSTGSPSFGSLVPNVLLRNHEGKYFVDVTASSGTGELHKGHAIAFADMTNNGHEDDLGADWRGSALRQPSVPSLQESWQRQRLDQREAGGRKNQPAGHRRANQSDGAKRGAGDALDLSLGRR